eukprot:scaffold3824_cov108-Isochrysis_galbana.AAC.5
MLRPGVRRQPWWPWVRIRRRHGARAVKGAWPVRGMPLWRCPSSPRVAVGSRPAPRPRHADMRRRRGAARGRHRFTASIHSMTDQWPVAGAAGGLMTQSLPCGCARACVTGA